MDIQWDKLELVVPFVFYVKIVGFARLVFQYLKVNAVAAAFETRHDAVVCCDAVAVVP